MSKTTSRFKFVKLEPTDAADITQLNENWDILDIKLHDYQKPWSVDGHIGAISPSESLYSTGNDDDTLAFSEEEKLNIYMKNSGDIYLTFAPYITQMSDLRPVHCVMTIYKNNQVIKSYDYSDNGIDGTMNDLYSNREKKAVKTIPLTVKKDDIITIGVKNRKSKVSINPAYFYVDKIQLLANIETPYIYMGLTEGNDEITATDILNALTGGTE